LFGQPALREASISNKNLVVEAAKHRHGAKDNLHAEHEHYVTKRDDSFSHHASSSAAFKPALRFLVQVVNGNELIALQGYNHGFEDVHVPALGNAKPNGGACFRQQPTAQGDSQAACRHLENYGLPHPHCVAAFHVKPPQ
jgi:hypothetical protein